MVGITEIKSVFENVICKTRYEYRSDIKNFGKCIEISNEDFIFDMDDLMFIWIRVLPIKEKYIVEIATIQLPEPIRRQGILTEIFNNLQKLSIISEIRITGVSTDAMNNWCIKHNMKNLSECDYTLKLQ